MSALTVLGERVCVCVLVGWGQGPEFVCEGADEGPRANLEAEPIWYLHRL